MKVETTAGIWQVRRRWVPRRLGAQSVWARFLERTRKVRRRTSDLADVPDPGCSGDLLEGIVGIIVIFVVVLFMVFVGLPFLIALGELLIIVLLALIGVVSRVLFRRPWTVDAVSPTGEHHVWPVVGWKASGAARKFVAERIVATGSVPSEAELAAAILV